VVTASGNGLPILWEGKNVSMTTEDANSGSSGSQDALREAVAHHQAGRLAEAETMYTDLLEDMPGNADLLRLLGLVIHQDGRHEEAVSYLEKAVEAEPGKPDFLCNLGVVLRAWGRQEEALSSFARALELAPGYAKAFYNRGTALQDLGRFDEAAADFEAALKAEPRLGEAICALGSILNEQGRFEAAAERLGEALKINPNNAEAHCNLGIALSESGKRGEARESFRKALEINPGHVAAGLYLRKVLSAAIPRWHFPMLADSGRNEGYRHAIEKAVEADSRVLDIGTGSGLLALMAARAGAQEVTSCEVLKPLAETARRIVADNGYGDRITVVNKKSNELRIGEDMAGPATVLVSEILDAGLLGEGVIPTLRHALAHLTVPGCKVIPQAATVHARLIEIPTLRAVNPVREVDGFDLSAFDEFRVPFYGVINLDLEAHRPLSDPFPAWEVDFRDLPPFASDVRPGEAGTVEVTATENGKIQAVVFWFDLHLDDEITLSSGPGGELSHWGQAIQFLDHDHGVTKEDRVTVRVRYTDPRIFFSLDQGDS